MGAGTMDLGAYPNVFRIVLLEQTESAAAALPYERDQVVEVVCNIDDDTAERIAWLAERLLEKGALEVWITPVTGKKGRAAVLISFLAANDAWAALADWMLRQSSTFGVRHRSWDRLKLVRKFENRDTPGGPVAYKIGSTTTGEILKEKAEFEDLKRRWDPR
jgi:pyridinium-3,5-bisthiocarboxylic acid mononucleotide nickel chelatase